MSKRLIKIYCFMCTHLKSTVNLQVNRNLHNVLVHREEKRSENFHARERPRYLNGSDHLVWVEISSNYSNKCVLLSYSQSYCQFIYQRHFTLYTFIINHSNSFCHCNIFWIHLYVQTSHHQCNCLLFEPRLVVTLQIIFWNYICYHFICNHKIK